MLQLKNYYILGVILYLQIDTRQILLAQPSNPTSDLQKVCPDRINCDRVAPNGFTNEPTTETSQPRLSREQISEFVNSGTNQQTLQISVCKENDYPKVGDRRFSFNEMMMLREELGC
jgi:hypothetical protein